MKWTPEFTSLTLNLSAYKATLDKHMQDWIVQAARVWLEATVSLIPTWSKASRATFQALARDIGTSVSYGSQQSRKDREDLGLSTGQGGLEPSSGKHRWYFFYHTSLRYLVYNEYNKAVQGSPPAPFSKTGLIHPTPYHFQEAGEREFREFARYTSLPNPYKFLRKKKVE